MFKNIWHRDKQPQVKELVAEARDLTKLGRYEEALALYERAPAYKRPQHLEADRAYAKHDDAPR